MFYSSYYFYLVSLPDRVDLKIWGKNFVIKLSVDILPSLVTLLLFGWLKKSGHIVSSKKWLFNSCVMTFLLHNYLHNNIIAFKAWLNR